MQDPKQSHVLHGSKQSESLRSEEIRVSLHMVLHSSSQTTVVPGRTKVQMVPIGTSLGFDSLATADIGPGGLFSSVRPHQISAEVYGSDNMCIRRCQRLVGKSK